MGVPSHPYLHELFSLKGGVHALIGQAGFNVGLLRPENRKTGGGGGV